MLRVDPHGDPLAAKFPGDVAHEVERLRGARADDDPRDPGLDGLLHRGETADAATQFAGNRNGAGDRAHSVEIALFTGKSRIEIDDVQVVAAFAFPAFRKRRGIVGINRLLVGLALAQAHDFTGHEVDGGEEDHGWNKG